MAVLHADCARHKLMHAGNDMGAHLDDEHRKGENRRDQRAPCQLPDFVRLAFGFVGCVRRFDLRRISRHCRQLRDFGGGNDPSRISDDCRLCGKVHGGIQYTLMGLQGPLHARNARGTGHFLNIQ